MEVRDIFELRKEGRFEEAYKAIMQIYAFHQGPHTNLCMFWCTNDLFKLRMKEKKTDEARRLLYQLTQLYPHIEDRLLMGNRAIVNASLTLDKHIDNFNLIYFMPYFKRMTDADWQPYVAQGHPVPSLGQQVVNHLLKNLPERDAKYIESIADIFHTALQKSPYYKENLRHLAQMHALVGKTDEAIATYKRLLHRHQDSYLYAELAKMISNTNDKIALYCMAINQQRKEEFRAKYHLELAVLMQDTLPARAAYELQCYFSIRQRHQQRISAFANRLQEKLRHVQPVNDEDERLLYYRAKAVVNKLINTQ